MTSSLTRTDFFSFQVSQNTIIRHYPLGTMGMLDRASKYAIDDPSLLAASVARQAIHFGRDYFTKQGLPIPILSTINNDFVKNMVTDGSIDMWSITRGASLSGLINLLVMFIHGLIYNPERDGIGVHMT